MSHELFIKAIEYATEKHKGQKRLDGKPYITHPIEVANSLTDVNEKIVAVLHDVLEDTTDDQTRTSEEMIDIFGYPITDSVITITKFDDESYERYIDKIKSINNPWSTAVKIADLKHNLSTIDNIPDLDKRKRLKERYERALVVLEG